jgi:hypothetical protein
MIICQQNFMFSSLWAMVKPFVGQKMRDRMHFVGRNLETMKALVELEHVSLCAWEGRDQRDGTLWMV